MSGQVRPSEFNYNQRRSSNHQTEEIPDPWRNDVYTPTETSEFKVMSSTASTIRRRYSYVPVGVKKIARENSRFPFNWLQLINIFMGTLALLLFVKLVTIVVATNI